MRRQLRSLALTALILGGVGALVLRLLPAEEPELVALPTDAPVETEVITPAKFSSRRLPALAVEAPAGWTLELDGKTRKLVARRPEARLVISTALLKEVVDAEALLKVITDAQAAQGFAVRPPLVERIGDLPAFGSHATADTRSTSTWMVKRGPHLVSSVMCLSEGKTPAREACGPLLAGLRWKTPDLTVPVKRHAASP